MHKQIVKGYVVLGGKMTTCLSYRKKQVYISLSLSKFVLPSVKSLTIQNFC